MLFVTNLDFRLVAFARESDGRTFGVMCFLLSTVGTLTDYLFAFKLINIVHVTITRRDRVSFV